MDLAVSLFELSYLVLFIISRLQVSKTYIIFCILVMDVIKCIDI